MNILLQLFAVLAISAAILTAAAAKQETMRRSGQSRAKDGERE